MKRRFAVYTSFSILIALLLIGSATLIQMVPSGRATNDFANWTLQQRTDPVLWLVDVAAFALILMMFRAGIEVARSQQQARAYADLAAEQMRMQEDHHRQVESLIARNVQLEKHNTELEERNHERSLMIGTLEAEVEAQQQRFEVEARRLTEQAFRAMEGQVHANTRQLDAVNMAMQYHRAELTQLRHGLRALQTPPEPAQIARLTPAEMAAITASALPSVFDELADSAEPVTSEPPAEAPAEEPAPEGELSALALTEVREESSTPTFFEAAVPFISAAPLSPAPLQGPPRNDSRTAALRHLATPKGKGEKDALLSESPFPLGEGLAERPKNPITPSPFGDSRFDAVTEAAQPSGEAPISAQAMFAAIPEVGPEDFPLPQPSSQPVEGTKTAGAEETLMPEGSVPKAEAPESQELERPAPTPTDWHIKI